MLTAIQCQKLRVLTSEISSHSSAFDTEHDGIVYYDEKANSIVRITFNENGHNKEPYRLESKFNNQSYYWIRIVTLERDFIFAAVKEHVTKLFKFLYVKLENCLATVVYDRTTPFSHFGYEINIIRETDSCLNVSFFSKKDNRTFPRYKRTSDRELFKRQISDSGTSKSEIYKVEENVNGVERMELQKQASAPHAQRIAATRLSQHECLPRPVTYQRRTLSTDSSRSAGSTTERDVDRRFWCGVMRLVFDPENITQQPAEVVYSLKSTNFPLKFRKPQLRKLSPVSPRQLTKLEHSTSVLGPVTAEQNAYFVALSDPCQLLMIEMKEESNSLIGITKKMKRFLLRSYKDDPVRVVSTRNGPEVGSGIVWSNLQLIHKSIWLAAQEATSVSLYSLDLSPKEEPVWRSHPLPRTITSNSAIDCLQLRIRRYARNPADPKLHVVIQGHDFDQGNNYMTSLFIDEPIGS